MKTEQEVRQLKANWLNDPCWDLEMTEGFEEYEKELLAYREMKEAQWHEEVEDKLRSFACRIGLANNLELAKYIQLLQDRVSRAESEIERLENPNS